MKPTPKQFMEAVQSMAAVIQYFPKDELGQRIIARSLEAFVNTEAELFWLTNAACESMRDFQRGGGLPELRGLFCTRFKPADKKTTYCITPGYRAEDFEAEYITKEIEENERRYEEYKRLAGPDVKPFPLPKPKLLQ